MMQVDLAQVGAHFLETPIAVMIGCDCNIHHKYPE